MRIFNKIAISFLGLLLSLVSFSNQKNLFKEGVLNLKHNTSSKIILKVEGECEFYWNQLLEPKDFKDTSRAITPQYVVIPKSWATYKLNGEKLPNQGFATYRLVIRKSSDESTRLYSLKLPSVFTSYNLWINGQLKTSVGTVGKTKEEHKPQFKAQEVPFSLDPRVDKTDEIEIVIQVSNFSHRRAGLPWPVFFGDYEMVRKSSRSNDLLNIIVIGIILIIGINHINLYLFRRKDVSNLYFGILTLVMILRNLTTGDRILGFIFPDISWELMSKLDNFSGYGTIPFFALFIYHLFKDDFRVWMKNTMVVLGAAISLFIFATPTIVYGKFNMFFELYLLLGGLYLTFGVLLVAALRNRPGALLTFLGMFILYATAINDVLSSMGIVQTAYVAPYGLVFFMLLQSFTITSKSARAINQNEDLSHQLFLEKQSLEKNIEMRTHELQKQHEILLEHQEKEKQQTWMNVGLTQINDVLSANKNDFKILSQKVLGALVKYLDVKMGALYVINDDDPSEPFLEMVADYGCEIGMKKHNKKIEPGDGLVGATFSDKETKLINSVPKEYFKVNSGLGQNAPATLLLIPLSTDEAVYGVVELASFAEFKPIEIEFIEKIAFNIATNLNNVRMNERNINLIQQFQEQSQEIQEKEERMRESLEELEYYRESYETLKHELDKLKSQS